VHGRDWLLLTRKCTVAPLGPWFRANLVVGSPRPGFFSRRHTEGNRVLLERWADCNCHGASERGRCRGMVGACWRVDRRQRAEVNPQTYRSSDGQLPCQRLGGCCGRKPVRRRCVCRSSIACLHKNTPSTVAPCRLLWEGSPFVYLWAPRGSDL
jgi:hypothetical protein